MVSCDMREDSREIPIKRWEANIVHDADETENTFRPARLVFFALFVHETIGWRVIVYHALYMSIAVVDGLVYVRQLTIQHR